MNIIAFIIGVLISIAVILHFKKTRLESSQYAYSILLFTFPFYYFVFAIYGKDYAALPSEFIGGLLFFIIAISTIKINYFYKFILLAIGYILHGVYDVIHNLFFVNAGTPIWWPEFCGVIDLTIGLYLATLSLKYRVKNA